MCEWGGARSPYRRAKHNFFIKCLRKLRRYIFFKV